MCGIAGILGPGADTETVTRMTRALAHRGPDDEGIWIDGEAELAFGHRRLAIIDPSPAGHQPMLSPSGRYVITFNGEIYNHAELRLELEVCGQGPDWRGHSDTETLLAGFDLWGIKRTLQRASGMFALALWDQEQRVLTLARDRMGEKPLYYGRLKSKGGAFLFASELKAFNQHPRFVPEIDPEALRLFVQYLAVPGPMSIYRGILKLLPGTMLTLRRGAAEPIVEEYWSAAEVARIGAANPIRLSPDEAAEELDRVLERAVGRQMIADVPLGAFLSGGIDSSTVVAIMQKLSPRPVKTFTIGFHEQAYNEAEHAKAVAEQLGTDHSQLYVTPEEAMAVIPRLPTIYDEPFADSSQIPTHLVSALAAGEVKVALSGDGGDELFGGYDRYLITAGLWDKIAGIPRPLRAVAAKALTMVPANAWTRLGDTAGDLLPRTIRLKRLGEKVHKGADMLCSESLDSLYDHMVSLWRDPELVIAPSQANPSQPAAPDLLGELGGVERMMARDMLGYLTNDILVKVDRAAMAVSLETRVPLLDPELVEFAWRLPLDMKIRGGTTKWLLRKVLYRYVPEKLLDRPKMGFGIPLDTWLRGPLRDWAEALLDEKKLLEQGFFSPGQIRSAWDAHLKGHNNQSKLWAILMFQSWLEASAKPFAPSSAAALVRA